MNRSHRPGAGTGAAVSLVLAIVTTMAIATTMMVRADAGAKDNPQPMIGETAPPFALKSVDGSTVRSDAMRGRWLVVHFGASW